LQIKEDITFPKDIAISDEAKDFVLKILKKNPDDRLKIDRLLDHPFLQRNVDVSELDL
jgi:serine/threonine protein kinase